MSSTRQPAVTLVGAHHLALGLGGKSVGDDDVHGQDEFAAPFLQELGSELDRALFNQGVAHLVPLGLEEGIGHAPADEQGIRLGEEVLDHADLVRDLGAAQDGHEGALGILDGLAQKLDLFLHQEPRHRGQVSGDPRCGGVGAMGRAEGVVHVHIGQLGQLPGELGVILLFFSVEAQVLQGARHPACLRRRQPQPLGRCNRQVSSPAYPVSSLRRLATGFRRKLSVTPLGRPRWEQRMTMAPWSRR
jgi:hypothetical protein